MANNAPCPIAVLNQPEMILASALLPMAVFDTPVVFDSNAETQSAVVETCEPFHHLQSNIQLNDTLPF